VAIATPAQPNIFKFFFFYQNRLRLSPVHHFETHFPSFPLSAKLHVFLLPLQHKKSFPSFLVLLWCTFSLSFLRYTLIKYWVVILGFRFCFMLFIVLIIINWFMVMWLISTVLWFQFQYHTVLWEIWFLEFKGILYHLFGWSTCKILPPVLYIRKDSFLDTLNN